MSKLLAERNTGLTCLTTHTMSQRDHLTEFILFLNFLSCRRQSFVYQRPSKIFHFSYEHIFPLVFTNLQNYATADRPRCMLRDDEIFVNRSDNRRTAAAYRYDNNNGSKHDVWNWNMSHLEYDHVMSSSNSSGNAKKSSQKPSKSNSKYFPASRSTTSSSTSSFQSFFRWFRRDHNKSSSRQRITDISYPRDIAYDDDVFETDDDEYAARYSRPKKNHQKVKPTTSKSSSSQQFNNAFYPSSSCDSVFSTASSFAFVPPVKYLKNRNQKQVSI